MTRKYFLFEKKKRFEFEQKVLIPRGGNVMKEK